MQYGLIGEHLGHSFSKEIHEMLGFYKYELKEVASHTFDYFMKKREFQAINVTIPYKEKVIPYLDEISNQAKRIQAVNTIVNRDGKLYGYNTDYFGLMSLIHRLNIDVANQKVLILGTGGTSKTAQIVCEDLGANPIIKVSRDKKNNAITYEEAYQKHSDARCIINTTPCGMYPNNEDMVIDVTQFSNLLGVIDVIYNPLQSKLVLEARKNNIKAEGGLFMLVEQAIKACEIFIDKQLDDVAITLFKKFSKVKNNIVLIGMPSCGKSTIGKVIASSLHKTFIDTDEEIEKEIGITISDFLEQKGEKNFRDIEEKTIKEIAKRQNQVIATGGGAVLRKYNIDNLKQNGIIYFINRSLILLTPTPDRPLSSNIKDLKKKYKERYSLYQSMSDVIINGDGDIMTVANLIQEDFLK